MLNGRALSRAEGLEMEEPPQRIQIHHVGRAVFPRCRRRTRTRRLTGFRRSGRRCRRRSGRRSGSRVTRSRSGCRRSGSRGARSRCRALGRRRHKRIDDVFWLRDDAPGRSAPRTALARRPAVLPCPGLPRPVHAMPAPLETLRTACMMATAIKPMTMAITQIMMGSSAVVNTTIFFSSSPS